MSIVIVLYDAHGVVLYERVEQGFVSQMAIARHIESLQRAYPTAVRAMLDIAL